MPGGESWGLESLISYNSLVLNDKRQAPNYYKIDLIDGLFGTDRRQNREAKASAHGENLVGKTLLGGRTITLRGRVLADNVMSMRLLQRKLQRAFAVDTEMPLKFYSDPLYKYQNLIPNPSPKNNTTGWVFSAGTAWTSAPTLATSTMWSRASGTSFRVLGVKDATTTTSTTYISTSGGGSYAPVVMPGGLYTASAWINVDDPPATGVKISILWYQSNNAPSAVKPFAESGFATAAGEQRVSVTDAAPSDAAYAVVRITGTTSTPSDTVDYKVDAIQLEPGALSNYVDGSTEGYNWAGADYLTGSSAMVPVQINCMINAEISMDESQESMKMERDFAITLRATNPRMVSPVERTLTLTPAAAATTATGTAVNNGDFPAELKVRVTGPTGADPKVRNDTTAKILRVNGTINTGTWVEFFTDGHKVRDHLAAKVPSFFLSTSDWLEIEDGSNTMVYELSAGAGGGTNATLTWRDTWL